MQTLGPPSVFIYYLPFSFFNLITARSTTTLINILCAVAITYLLSFKLFKTNKLYTFLMLNLILFSAFPARFSLEMGQPNLFLTLIITLILIYNKKNPKEFLTGVLILLKTYFLFIPFSFLKESRAKLLKTVAALVIVAVLFFPIITPSSYIYYIKFKFMNMISSGNTISGLDYYNQSYASTLARFGVLLSSKAFYLLIVPAVSYIVYLLGNVEFAIIAGLILSFVSWQHYYVILFPIFVKIISQTQKNFLHYAVISTLIFFWWVEFPWLHNSARNLYTNMLASHYFLTAVGLGLYIVLTKYKNKLTPLT